MSSTYNLDKLHDHHTPLTDRNLVEDSRVAGFSPYPRFLSYPTRSRLPQVAWLVRLYLKFPPIRRLLSKQALVVAKKAGAS